MSEHGIPPLPWQHSQKGVYIKDQRGKVIAEVVHARMDAAAFIVRAVNNFREWQPIETAPKDGTEVLIYSERNGVRVARYEPFAWAPNSNLKWFIAMEPGYSGGAYATDPTLWHPSPPIQQAKSEETT